MKDFYASIRMLLLSAPILILGVSPRQALAGGDNAQLGQALMSVGTMGAMVTVASMDGAASVADCARCATGTCNANVPHWNCVALPLSIAAIIAGLAMMSSGSDTAAAVEGEAGADFETPEAPAGFDPSDWSQVNSKLCNEETKNTVLCDPDGKEKLKQDLALVDDLNNKGLIVVDDPAKLLNDIDKAKRAFDNFDKGDYGAIASDANGAAPIDSDEAGRGRANLADTGAYSSGADDYSEFGTGASANYKGKLGLVSSGGDGSGGGKVGPKGAKLGDVEWNGSLDMIDAKTGKSLTLWERATRRYMGTPDGKRGFTMARIEFLRKQSSPKLASEKAAEKKAQKGKSVAKNEKPKSPIQPVQMSASQLLGH